MLTTVISPRKIFLPGVFFLAILLIFYQSLPSSHKLPANHPASGAAEKGEAEPVITDPNEGKFQWAQVTQRYPVESLIPLPTDTAAIPRIQHDFPPESEEARKARISRLEEIKAEFQHAWKGYKEHAWLRDEVGPISGDARDTFGGWAATLIDSLDTLWVMGLKPEFDEAVAAISTLDFTTCTLDTVNIFETTTRHLGGLLSAHDLSSSSSSSSSRDDLDVHPSLLHKATELGDMLLQAFDTPNHLPLTRWPFPARLPPPPDGGERPPASEAALSAELGSLTLEFTRLAQLTGSARHYDAVARVADAFAAQQNATKLPGMWPVAVNARDADFTAWSAFTVGGMADSLYEYLPKQYALLGGGTAAGLYRGMFEGAARAMKDHLLYRPMTKGAEDVLVAGDVVVESEEDGGTRLDPRNQHLACFAGGMFAIAGRMFERQEDVDVGRKLTEGCLWAYETSPNGIMPEIMHTVPCEDSSNCNWDEQKWLEAVKKGNSEKDGEVDGRSITNERHLREGVSRIEDARYILRPEAIESIFILYRITGDEKLRERAWKMFRKIIEFTRTDIAHAGLDDCVTESPPKADTMESFWTAETLKYFYLLFAEPNVVSLDEYVLNTEAHPLKRPS